MTTDHLICGDSAEKLKCVASSSADLTVTSPPYDNLRKYDGFTFDFDTIAEELFRVTKDGGVVVWVVADCTINGSESGTSFRQALKFMSVGFKLHDTMIYQKGSYMPLTHNRYEQSFEYMFVFVKGKLKTFNPIMIPCETAGTKRSRRSAKQYENSYAERQRDEKTTVKSEKQHPNIFTYQVGKNDRTLHNAPFPEELVHDQILSWSNPDDVVLDPFMGSGTTGKVANILGRKFIGVEISEKYFNIAVERINKAKELKND